MRMLLTLLLLAAWSLIIASALTGDHVCHRVENYTVASKEQYVEPVEIHTLVWCLQVPPRCSQKRTELRERWRTKTEVKFKSVPVCCEGYVMQEPVGNGSADAKCVPHCKRCRSGVCSAPNECTCDPGFQGQDCSFECPQGTWGRNCEHECNCLRELACDPVSGKCECPAGWTGPRCENKCPEGQWGLGCKSLCLCENPSLGCNHETGECVDNNNVAAAPIDPFEASGISGNLVPKTPDPGEYVDVIDFDKEAILPRITDNESETAAMPEEQRPTPNATTTTTTTTSTTGRSSPSSTKTIEAQPTVKSTSPLPRATSRLEGNQLSQPDEDDVDDSENMLTMAKTKNNGYEFDERHTNFRVIVSPKNDYVKTTHNKGDSSASMSTIPIDVAAMIVVGAIVSIGLTSVAALMIFHVRSRLLKAALAIYSQEKVERQLADKDPTAGGGGGAGAGKALDVTIGTLPRTMTRINPVYEANPIYDANILTLDERPAEYANGTVTIGIRLSSNLRDLLESHYDRPAACPQPRTATLATGEPDVEHVYDEIPLSAPFYFAKDT